MDKDTGVEQTSSKWGDGLHQFIQLKHNGKLSDESLKAVYMSNAGYFQSYQNLFGMTGTVGDIEGTLCYYILYIYAIYTVRDDFLGNEMNNFLRFYNF